MLELNVYDMTGSKVDSMTIDEAALGGTVNRPLLRQAVLMYQASRRAGTASTKTRGEINGSRKKPFRQKGTGRARQGSWLAPQHRGGGVPHGPHPRDFRYSIPKKARIVALKSAYLDKLQSGTRVLDQLQLEAPKTKQIAQLLQKLDIKGTCLIATLTTSEPLLKSIRNIPGVEIKRVRDINAYDLLRLRDFIVTRRALESVVERFAAETPTESKA